MSRFRLRALAPLAAVLFLWIALPLSAADVPRGASHEPVPYVYDPAAWKAVPKAFLDDGPACVLHGGTTFLVEPSGTVEEVLHEVMRLNNRRGVELLGEFRSIAYDPSYQKLTLQLARVHKPDGRTVDVAPAHTHLRDTNTDYQVYSGSRQLVISFPDLAVGDVIEVKWSLRGKDPEGHDQFYGAYNFGNDDYPTVHDELRILMPRGRALHYSARGGKLEPVVYEDEEARLYHWQVRIKPPLPADKYIPTKEELRLRLFYGTFASWDEVGDWCRAVRQGCWECTPEVGRIAREVTKGMTDEADKARALTYWLRKNVRYLSLHDRDTWAPLVPQRVFAARYGDCKDQSQILAVMLREAGVKAGVAIISWADSGDIRESFPSPWGNHAIVLTTIAGKEQWIDPVYSHAAWDVVPPEDCDRLCFVMDEKGPVRLVRTPKLRPEQNRIEQTTRVKVARDGAARGEREIIYCGVAAANERDELLSLPEAARKEHLLKDLQEFHERVKVTKATVDPRSLEDLDEPVRVRVEFDVAKEFAASGSAHVSDVQVFYRLLAYRAALDRKLPLAAGQPCEMKHRFVAELAPGYRFTGTGDRKTAKSPWGTFTRTAHADTGGRRIEVQSHLVFEKTRVESAELAAFVTFQKEVRENYGSWLSRSESTELADAASMETELKAAPADAELALLLARLYRANSKPGEASRVLQAGLGQARDDRLARALLEVADEQQKEAKTARGQAHWQLARSASDRKKWNESLDHLAKAGENDPTILLTPDALDLKGRVCEKLGKSVEAMGAFEEMLNLDPNDQRALSALIGLELSAKDRTKAMGHLRRYTVAVGGAAPGLATAADFHLQLDRLDDALDLATRSNQAAQSAVAERVLGLVHLRRGDNSEAAAHLTAALNFAADKTKPDGAVLEGLIRAELRQGELSAAEALAKTAATTEAPPGLKPLCATVMVLGQRRAALLKEVKAPAGKAVDCAKVVERVVCAEQAQADGRTAKEIESLLSAALADGVEVGPGLALRGLLALERGRLSQALADAQRATALSPNETRGYYVRGRVWLERGDARAVADLEKAAALGERQDAAVLHWLAAALYQEGRAKEAVAAQREALQRRPGDGELAEQLRRFEGAQR
jgi:tetratricopeptide (TPR) repeat protein/transglutaminase-like putative cysteine protease